MDQTTLPAEAQVSANGADTAAVVNHLYGEVRPYQWLRELLENSRDAGAARFSLDVEPQAAARHLGRRALVSDDGRGMSPLELLSFARLGCSSKQGHFGVGAKVTTLPWNPDGVVVGSYQRGRGALIWIKWDSGSRSYVLRRFETTSGSSVVADPDELWDGGVRWGKVAPKWVRDHGTFVVLLGSRKYPDTVLGDVQRAEGKSRNIVKAINTRYWDLSDIDARAWNPVDKATRQLVGAKHYVVDVERKKRDGQLADSGTIDLARGRVRADWYLWVGERPNNATYGDHRGFVAVRYQDELYERYEAPAHLGLFGVVGPLQRAVTVVLTPQEKERGWGVEPTTSRHGLTLWEGYRQVSLPAAVAEWGAEFVARMPEAIKRAHREIVTQQATQLSADDELLSILGPGSGFDRAMRAARSGAKSSDVSVADPFGDHRGRVVDEVLSTLPLPDGSHSADQSRVAPAGSDPRLTLAARPSQVVESGKRGVPASSVRAETFRLPRTVWSDERDPEVPWAPIRWQPLDVDGQQLVTVYGASPFIQPLLITLNEERKKRGPIVQGEVAAKAQEAIRRLSAAAIVHVRRVAEDLKLSDEQTREMLSPERLASVFAGFVAQRTYLRQKVRGLGGAEED